MSGQSCPGCRQARCSRVGRRAALSRYLAQREIHIGGSMRVGFIGLGNMGLPLARHLLQAGHKLSVYNRTRARADRLKPLDPVIADSPSAAARGAEVLVTMVADDPALEAVLLGEQGALAALPTGAIHVSMSTISPGLARRLAERHRAAGHTYVAAPVFGRPEAAEAGKLWIVAAGPAAAIERCRPLFDAMGQGIVAAIEALGEAFALGRKYGIAPADLLDIVNGRLFRSPIYENYGKLIADQRYEPAGFKLKYGLKDVRLALAAADDVAAPLPLASLVRDRYLSAVARGWQEIDWAALARIAAADAGL